MLAARVVLRGFDAIAWGSASPSRVALDAIEVEGRRLGPDALAPEEIDDAIEVLWDAWERACWAPEVGRRKAA